MAGAANEEPVPLSPAPPWATGPLRAQELCPRAGTWSSSWSVHPVTGAVGAVEVVLACRDNRGSGSSGRRGPSCRVATDGPAPADGGPVLRWPPTPDAAFISPFASLSRQVCQAGLPSGGILSAVGRSRIPCWYSRVQVTVISLRAPGGSSAVRDSRLRPAGP